MEKSFIVADRIRLALLLELVSQGGSLHMKYVNAKQILPDKLLRELQGYFQGGYIYIPIEQNRQKSWGEVSGYRRELQKRNAQITENFKAGVSVEKLAEKYCLSVHAIRKIIYQK